MSSIGAYSSEPGVVLPPDRQTASLSYIVVTPAKDEARHIEKTLTSMLAQTHRPLQWVIVDDGSSDGTAEIVEKYAGVHDFIRLLRAERVTTRATGTAEVRAFLRGFELVRHETYDCIVKLDADLSFDRDYFEKLLTHFHADPRLGIASGVYLEAPEGGEWQEVTMPSYHAAGASKVIRRTCFEEIGGFIQERGWDTVDEIRAVARNWRTGHFTDLKMQHWKPEGTGMGRLRTSYMHGEIYCRTRGGALFFLMKTLRRLTWRPFIVGSLAMLWGYLHAFLRRREPLVTAAEGHRYRQLLTERMRARTRRFLPDL